MSSWEIYCKVKGHWTRSAAHSEMVQEGQVSVLCFQPLSKFVVGSQFTERKPRGKISGRKRSKKNKKEKEVKDMNRHFIYEET